MVQYYDVHDRSIGISDSMTKQRTNLIRPLFYKQKVTGLFFACRKSSGWHDIGEKVI
jgi:hypothetical protein